MGREQRKAKRYAVRLGGIIQAKAGQPIVSCEVRDISATGAQLALPRDVELPAQFILVLSQDGYVRRLCRKVWQFSILVGVRFAELD